MPDLSKPLEDAFGDQINLELSSAYVYLGMSAYCESIDFRGAAHWLRVQWEEELVHALKLLDHVGERGGRVTLKEIRRPPAQTGSLLELFERVLNHEKEVTASIYRVYDLSVVEKDYGAQALLQWFVNEQIEEEKSATEIVSMLRLAGDGGSALFMVDRELAGRARSSAGQPGAAD